MPVVTLQLGQCGNQLGYSFFQTLANELSASDYGQHALEEYFRPLQYQSNSNLGATGNPSHVARAVMIDMEPKVVQAARATASSSGGWWRYPPKGFLCMQSGAGNNWAHGFHGYGPSVHEDALNLVRREVEACDLLGGFTLLQSMAGGTGAGLGTYVAQALREEYQSSNIINCCVWPYESGEVIVQSYNTLLTLSHLSDLSDGIILMSNEALHRLCQKVFNLPRPSFQDMNSVAAQALANMLLPSQHRPVGAHHVGHENGVSAAPLSAAQRDPRLPPHAKRTSSPGYSPGQSTSSYAPRTPVSTSPSYGSSFREDPGPMEGGYRAGPSVRLLSDIVTHLCCHPHYRLLTLRSIPQLPTNSAEFTTFTWPAMQKRLKQMLVTGSIMEEGMDWSVNLPSSQSPGNSYQPQSTNSPLGRGGGGVDRGVNKVLSNWMVLRGRGADQVDVSDFANPALYPPWAVDPLMASSSTKLFNKYEMSAAMLSNDQACISPVRRMQERAAVMMSARAYVHQYEKFGLGVSDFSACFGHIEDIVERYSML
ncbi:hypothetical protein CEUSTIGMA_g7187.t1 [Chlamydomonas eustigma]|uniref:Tubulin delta chain n=1 Tax=Chlamydomonas eustigma TaxID=1157962 RepID=A0A250X9M8_9CHLO|nr:hypothetical protein CEUSTIGMA_g7187.t1 [Chlamydomonas eustigma]|eukprot:GAX79746.1 hypothetical protein CEUSTIGMA_g7187.t1 [Chlamydomonas eustigma]